MLEKRALVTRDTNRIVKIHDIILKIGLNKGKGTRYTIKESMLEVGGHNSMSYVPDVFLYNLTRDRQNSSSAEEVHELL